MKFLRLQPLVSLAWSVTDEFGNFHYTHNPDGLTELPAFALNGLLYSEDDLDELAADLRAFIDIPEGAIAEYFRSDAVQPGFKGLLETFYTYWVGRFPIKSFFSKLPAS